MTFLYVIISLIALALFAQSLFSLYLMLYSWEHPGRLEASAGPRAFVPPSLSFSVLLPARHEEAVIYDTIKKVVAADYPRDLLEVVVICHADDTGTIAEARRAINEIGGGAVSVAIFSDPPINKPHGLNVGLARTSFEVVTIFDAEDDIDANIFNVVNTVMMTETTGVVQAGVQLMNFRDHWFSIHNCLEYFFWFKSRLHFNAHVGVIPLGGNSVFMRRVLLERIGGWDVNCLTEDADMGLRLSALGEPIRVVYDAQHVTREETPDSVAAFIRQRTRWHQGFIQILGKGSWLRLPRFGQRLLALYTLTYPLLQATMTLLWPLTILGLFWLKLPVLVVMLAFLPLYTLAFQFRGHGHWRLSVHQGVSLQVSPLAAFLHGGDLHTVPDPDGGERHTGRLSGAASSVQLGKDRACGGASSAGHRLVRCLPAPAGRSGESPGGRERERTGIGSRRAYVAYVLRPRQRRRTDGGTRHEPARGSRSGGWVGVQDQAPGADRQTLAPPWLGLDAAPARSALGHRAAHGSAQPGDRGVQCFQRGDRAQ